MQLASLVLDDNRPPETKVRAGTAIDVTIQPGKTVYVGESTPRPCHKGALLTIGRWHGRGSLGCPRPARRTSSSRRRCRTSTTCRTSATSLAACCRPMFTRGKALRGFFGPWSELPIRTDAIWDRAGPPTNQLLPPAWIQHALHLRYGRVRHSDRDQGLAGPLHGLVLGSLAPTTLLTVDGSRAAHACVGAARGCDLPGDLRQVPRPAPRHLQVVRHFVRPVWPDHHAAPDHVTLPLHAQHARVVRMQRPHTYTLCADRVL